MGMTEFFAQFYGLYLLIIVLLMMARRDSFRQVVKVVEDKKSAVLSGFIALLIGLATVILHQEWVLGEKVVITVIGWLVLAKGIVLIGWPEKLAVFSRTVMDEYFWPWAIVTLVLGLYLVYLGDYMEPLQVCFKFFT